ncbi:MAG: phosphoribosyltransferase family protein [Myxococcota bacterium]
MEAGEVLARELEAYQATPDLLVLALPRGGVPVGAVVARQLGAELDVMVVRKLGVPGHEELAMGAVASGGVRLINEEVVHSLGLSPEQIEPVVEAETAELHRQEGLFRGVKRRAALAGRTIILTDDGVATGATMRSAIAAIRANGPQKLVVAVPVAPQHTLRILRREADEVVCPLNPGNFSAVGQFYADFSQVSTAEAQKLIEEANARAHVAAGTSPRPTHKLQTSIHADVEIPVRGAAILGTLSLPEEVQGIVAFAHGSGSSRFSTRNALVARTLEERSFGTLLVDLLTANEEAADRAESKWRFDIGLLAERVVSMIDWLVKDPRTGNLPLGLFGASTGAAAALCAAAERPAQVMAIVSRGGRPDLAGSCLPSVRAPTLLIVGGEDRSVLQLNRAAAADLFVSHRIEVIPGAKHLFSAPGELETVATLAADFFHEHLRAARATTAQDSSSV